MRDLTLLWSAALGCAVVLGCGGRGSPSEGGTGGATGGDGSAGASASDGSSGSSGNADAAGPCGGENQLCCVSQCDTGLVCVSNFPNPAPPRCHHCGGNGEPCCPLPNDCAPGLVCWQTIDSGNHCGPPRDGSTDPPCITSCTTIGGQYCGRIGDRCGRSLDCGECTNPDFTCGGAGLSHVCGASRDSGVCEVTVCETPTGKYCGNVGDGCGAAIDCGGCSSACRAEGEAFRPSVARRLICVHRQSATRAPSRIVAASATAAAALSIAARVRPIRFAASSYRTCAVRPSGQSRRPPPPRDPPPPPAPPLPPPPNSP